MKRKLRTVVSAVAALLVMTGGMIGSSQAASAAVVVPPGGAGSTCSEYHFVTPEHYWQTCAWADYRYIWFTVNFGNTDSDPWYPDMTYIDYIKAGVKKVCPAGAYDDFVITPFSTRGTDRMSCVLTRVRGAFASVGTVIDGKTVEKHSPTLQVQ